MTYRLSVHTGYYWILSVYVKIHEPLYGKIMTLSVEVKI